MFIRTRFAQAQTKFPVFVNNRECRKFRIFLQGERRLGRYLNDTPLALNEYIALRLAATMVAKRIGVDAYFYDYEGKKVYIVVTTQDGRDIPFADWLREKSDFLCATEMER